MFFMWMKSFFLYNIYNMLTLKEAIEKRDNGKIILYLISIRSSSKNFEIDRNTFGLLIDLIKAPNTKIMNYSLSIIGNCCYHNNYRLMFKEMGGVPHLLLVARTVDNDSIICRACRLMGNLALNIDVAKEMCKQNAIVILFELLKNQENISCNSQLMIFRAIKKLWNVAELKVKSLPDNLSDIFHKYFDLENTQIVCLAMETLIMLSNIKGSKNDKFKVSKKLFLKVIELSKKEELNHLAVLYLSHLICYQTSFIWSYLEGSNIAQTFIEHLQKVDHVNGGVLKAFNKLCTEVAVRNKVRNANLLPRLIELSNQSNVKRLLTIFYLFQYDLVSMLICAQYPKFISILIENILMPGAIPLLVVLSRLSPPVKELVLHENLDVIIKNKECTGILKNIIQTRQFLKALLISGNVWRIEKAGCSMEEIGCLGYSEGIIIDLLSCGEKKYVEEVSLAIPFLIKPRNFELLYKLLAHHQAIPTILHLLKENPLEEKILASVIRLIEIFRFNYHHSTRFFQDFGSSANSYTSMELSFENSNSDEKIKERIIEKPETCQNDLRTTEMVTLEFDDGNCLNVNKNLLCKNSPVLESMLNGHFIEARQEKVKLRNCSEKAMILLVKLLNVGVELPEIEIEIYLELLSLTDRFLLINLNNFLTENLKIDQNSCPTVYQWCRKAGFTKNNAIVQQKVYKFLFSSSEYLLVAMKNISCRVPLINEISSYLSSSLMDLL